MDGQYQCLSPGNIHLTFNATITGVLSALCTAVCTAPRAASMFPGEREDGTRGEEV